MGKIGRATLPPLEILLVAHEAQAKGLKKMFSSNEIISRQEREHQLGNYLLLTMFVAPDFDSEGYPVDRKQQERKTFIDGLLNVGVENEIVATETAKVFEGSDLRDNVRPGNYLPPGSRERFETETGGWGVDYYQLCAAALRFGELVKQT